MTNTTIDATKLPEKQRKREVKKKIPTHSKDSNCCAYYLCEELDCGFYYFYKKCHGPSKYHPLLAPSVLVVDLGIKVSIYLAGWGKQGFDILIDHGHEGYIFPVNLHDKPFRIDPRLGGEEDEKWKKLIASFKGEEYTSSRKTYVLVDNDGNVIRRKLCNEEEFKATLEYQKDWQKRHPGQESFSWKLEG